MADRQALQLDAPPSLTTLYARAVAGFGTSSVRRLPVVGGLPGLSRLPGFAARGDTLPDTELVLPHVDVAADHLHRYEEVCGFSRGERLALSFPHVLTFPLSMALMTDSSFPFPVIGMVHIENRITQHRPLLRSETLAVRVWAQDLRDHRRGTQFDVCAEVSGGDELAWEGRSTYLYREADKRDSSDARSSKGGREDGSEQSEPDTSAVWEVPEDVGRRYAEVSGDRNPIHTHPLSARLFGMPRAIAHGMWVFARCLAAFEGHEPESAVAEASFKLPLLLPSRVAFTSAMAAGERRFSVRGADSDKPHLSGSLRAV